MICIVIALFIPDRLVRNRLTRCRVQLTLLQNRSRKLIRFAAQPPESRINHRRDWQLGWALEIASHDSHVGRGLTNLQFLPILCKEHIIGDVHAQRT